ncbi:MAG: DUF5060 domain-containing protein [Capsulimonadales bacterium]|nr:DUF5060 domain-containing protein [Capsulimonadales bacterium]
MLLTLLPALWCVTGTLSAPPSPTGAGTYAALETSFELPGLTGNPFDATENDIRATFAAPGGRSVTTLAFFDGGSTWRVRYTPTAAGTYELRSITRNGRPFPFSSQSAKRFVVQGKPTPGFIRVDPKHPTRLAFENGAPYYPIGHNVAWKSGDTPDVAEIFDRMGQVSENWSRVWMNHWDNKNLDWTTDEKVPPGQLSLKVARRWDEIVRSAERNGIHFQMTLQHHGQYSTTVNSNWDENPWNRKNGGFLDKPEEFFTGEEARRRTRNKYRYIVARWGYSPHVLAWELFNEVQFTDAVRNGQVAAVAAWHREMANHLRGLDIYRHPVITSSDTGLAGVYEAMDYLQPHAYPPDVAEAALSLRPDEWKKPIFFGEIGPGGDLNADTGQALHDLLWASVVSESSGAAQYWTWDNLHRRDLYARFTPVIAFVKAAGIAETPDMKTVRADVRTPGSFGTLHVSPGAGWSATEVTRFPILADGTVRDAGRMPEYFQGKAHAAMFPFAEFPVTLEREAVFTLRINESAKSGAHVLIRRNGAVVAERDFPAAEGNTRQSTEISVTLPPGEQVIRLENTGADWVKIGGISLTPYGPTLRVAGKSNGSHGVLRVRNGRPDGPGQGRITIPEMSPGRYAVTWWDTTSGKPVSRSEGNVTADRRLLLTTPSIDRDIAVLFRKSDR